MINNLLNDLADFNAKMGDKMAKRLKLKLLERAIKRMESFSKDCEECEKCLIDLNNHFQILKNKQNQMEKPDFKEHQRKVRDIISHLQKEHKLVTEGYYVGTYMSMGISFGLIFGLLLFDNLALGLPIGLSIGLVIGSARDADAKKKGLTI